MEAREQQLHEQLTDIRHFAQIGEATGAPLRSFQPFSEAIHEIAIPRRFREPTIGTYDGIGDPQIHVDAFQTQMMISGDNDAISCKMFARTLTDVHYKKNVNYWWIFTSGKNPSVYFQRILALSSGIIRSVTFNCQ